MCKSSEEPKKTKLKRYIQKLFLLTSLITVGIGYPAKVISQQLSESKINRDYIWNKKFRWQRK